jgi:uncharacterized repeat protein (TIGR01451 family)
MTLFVSSTVKRVLAPVASAMGAFACRYGRGDKRGASTRALLDDSHGTSQGASRSGSCGASCGASRSGSRGVSRNASLGAAYALACVFGSVSFLGSLAGTATLVGLTTALVPSVALAAPPAVETPINNVASVEFIDPVSNRNEYTTSNTVTTYVLPVGAYSLTAPQTRNGATGTTLYFPHTLTNSGNVPLTFGITATNQAPGATVPTTTAGATCSTGLGSANPGTFNFATPTFVAYADANGDGIPDSLTPLLTTPSVPAGGSYNFLVAAPIPGGAINGTVDSLAVTATPTSTNYVGGTIGTQPIFFPNCGTSFTVEDRVNVTTQAAVEVRKALMLNTGPSPSNNTNPANSPANPTNGQLRVTFTIQNTGATAATDVLITDDIGTGAMAGFSYVPGSGWWSTPGVNPLTDAIDGDGEIGPGTLDYRAPTAGGTGQVRILLRNLAANATATVHFNVTVRANVPFGVSQTTNTANYSYDPDGPGPNPPTTPTPTNQPSYFVSPTISPDLTITKSHVGNFTLNTVGAYTVTIRNIGSGPTTAPITVTDTLPLSFTYNSAFGAGFACTPTPPVTINCTTNNVINPGGSMSLTVTAIPTANGSFVNRVNVSGGGELPAATLNNEAFDPTGVGTPVDLTISKTHTGNFTVGQVGVYSIQVSNVGSTSTTGSYTVVDELPAWLQVVIAGAPGNPSAITGGTGWTCSVTTNSVTFRHRLECSSSVAIGPGGTNPNPISVYVIPQNRIAQPTVTNTAVVSGGGEGPGLTGNNTANDPTTIVASASTTATVSGTVWLDLNHNRVRESGETLLPDWIVELVRGGVVVGTTRTNAQGFYQITGVTPGSGYDIIFREPTTSRPITGTAIDGENTARYSYATVSGGILTNITFQAGDNVIEQSLPLDPSGVVYDSQTRQPVAGATVTIVGPPGFNANLHLVGGAGNVTQVTGPMGMYQYLFLNTAPAGVYELQVTVPAGSQYAPFNPANALIPPTAATGTQACAPATPFCIRPGSGTLPGGVLPVQAQPGPPPNGQPTTYYLRLQVDPSAPNALGIVNNHIPIDPLGGAVLLVSKSADKSTAELGDFVNYKVRVTNTSAFAAANLRITDGLPFGFQYLPGTARFFANPAANVPGVPVEPDGGSKGPTLVFSNLGSIPANQAVELTYRVRLGVGANLGDGINTAFANATSARSNNAAYKVRVTGGVFSDKAFLVGKVFMDCNRNRVQDDQEPGIPGVRIYLQDGTHAVTDSEGKYSLYGLSARTTVVKVDITTMPADSEMVALQNRNAGTADSRFADLKRGELHRADFAEGSCTEAIKNRGGRA